MSKLKITPNKPGIPCYQENSTKVQVSINNWKNWDRQNNFKSDVTMDYWEVKSGCTAL